MPATGVSDPTLAGLVAEVAELRAEVARVATECNVEIDLQRAIEFAPSEFDPACVDAVRSSTQVPL